MQHTVFSNYGVIIAFDSRLRMLRVITGSVEVVHGIITAHSEITAQKEATENYVSDLSSSISLPRPCVMAQIGSLHLGSRIPA